MHNTVRCLQQDLDSARQQAAASSIASADLFDRHKMLRAQLESAEAAAIQTVAANNRVEADMSSQVNSLQQQLASARGVADAAAAGAAALSQRLTDSEAAQALAQEAEELSQQHLAERQKLIDHLQQRLQDAQVALHQQTEVAAAADAQRRQEIESVQQQLADAVAAASASQTSSAESAETTAQLRAQLESTQGAAATQAGALSAEMQDLQQQVSWLIPHETAYA